MKYFLKLLIITLLINSSSVGLIGCSIPSVGDIWIITDGGDLFDKAFNQQVLEGSKEFTKTFNDNRIMISNLPGNEVWKNKKMKTRWIISRDSTVSTLQNNYNLATFAGAKTIIVVGFNHLGALTPAIKNQYKKLGVRFILVDAKLEKPVDVACLSYSAEQSGFLSGLAGAIWLAANHETYDDNGLKMSTFGSLPADTIVSYMMGYYWGVYYFNKYRNSNDNLLEMTNAIRIKEGKEKIEKWTNKFDIHFDKIAKQFTGSFESGTKSSKAITSQLIDGYKDDIVMPVAGAQTIDLVSAVKNSTTNSKAKIIGVDVDQSVQYSYAKDIFITSALKGIHKSVNTWLWHSFNLDYNKDDQHSVIKPINGEQYFDGSISQPALGGQQYLGIANNDSISAIYNNLIIDSNDYWRLAQKVTDAYNKLVADLVNDSTRDKWENAWKNYVDESVEKYKPQF
ncbi:BMP family ABC transporter substrate-binding protein [Spiroplasma endosymbiont of Apeira syringaria]|uniref:BMP family ABC transporter substrate-binding protein n=1 Tax=Spiroplasma endosymbiont of Apeira syringaria TaxID=3066307 RepID=UPI0030CEF027